MRVPAVLAATVLTACAGSGEGRAAGDFLPDERPPGKTLVYECGEGVEFIARVGPGEMALWLGDRYLVLSQVRSASGTKYREGDVQFWSKGQAVMLEVAGRRYRDCRLNPARAPWEDARRRGVEFRAVGNEPGWSLELRGQRLEFSGDYGASRLRFSAAVDSAAGRQRRLTASGGGRRIAVTIVETACRDSMKGEAFPYAVSVELDGRRYRGCGRSLDRPWE